MKAWVLTFNTATSLFEGVDVRVYTTLAVQLVPEQVPFRVGSYSIVTDLFSKNERGAHVL